MKLALYQPEIPQNTGTLVRLGACLSIGIDIIEPCSFVLDDVRLKRAGMDYIDIANIQRHQNWASFYQHYQHQRIILLDTKAEKDYLDFNFEEGDVLLVGRESDGVPKEVYEQTAFQLKINIAGSTRSLNVAVAASMVIGEAIRQLRNKEC
jgi:tRNA (cytidine/uridine-2'-O-)-methyltransferase